MALDEKQLERIGEQFGEYIAQRMREGIARVGVIVDVDDTYATFSEWSDDAPIRVPLMCLNAGSAVLKVKPKLYSSAIVLYVNGQPSLPIFVGFTEVDEVNVSVGESSVTITNGLIEFNEGKNKGMVLVEKLTDRLNKLQGEIEQIQAAISGHTHPYVIAPSTAATTSPPTYSKVPVSRFDASEYANDKITQ